jgi:2-oxo-4-hydroxy-4-carboxy-5-ureidoimidazoline decarboxylase
VSGLDHLNGLPAADAERELLACCGSYRWAATVAAGRPYATADALHQAAARAWWALGPDDWRQAFAAHPRIGDRERASTDVQASREQVAVADAGSDTLAQLAEGNRRYEARFARVFLVRASGRTAEEMLALLRTRLANDPETELRVAAGEQADITRLRLNRLLEPDPA